MEWQLLVLNILINLKRLKLFGSTMLAALPKAPSRYNPFKYPDQAKFRRDLVLNNLYENKFISKDEFKIFKEKLNLKKRLKFLMRQIPSQKS